MVRLGIERQTQRTLAVIFAGFCAFLTVYATQPILPALRQILGISEFLASLTVTASTLGMALTAPFAGRISDRIGRKRTIVIAGFSLAVATLGPIGDEMRRLTADTAYVDAILKRGADRAGEIGARHMNEVKDIMGLLRP